MLNDEKDIESFIIMRRLTALLVKAVLEPHHQSLFPYFQKYVLRASKIRDKTQTIFMKAAEAQANVNPDRLLR